MNKYAIEFNKYGNTGMYVVYELETSQTLFSDIDEKKCKRYVSNKILSELPFHELISMRDECKLKISITKYSEPSMYDFTMTLSNVENEINNRLKQI